MSKPISSRGSSPGAEPGPSRAELLARIRELEAERDRYRDQAEAPARSSAVVPSDSVSQFRAMADAAPVMLWMTDTENLCTYLSQGWYDYTGQTEEQGAGFGWLRAVHPEDRDGTRRRFLDAAARREPFSLDHRLRRADGEFRWAIDEGRPRVDDRGEWQGYIGSVIDVHDRWTTADALRQSEARYRTLFESIDEGFCVIQLIFDEQDRAVDYRFVETNPAFVQQSGLRDAVGRTARELLPGLEEHWFRTYGDVARTGKPIRFESGSEVMQRWFDVFAFPVDHAERKVALLFTDVTEYRRTDQALRRSAEQLQGLADAALAIHSAQTLDAMLGVITEQARLLIQAHQAVTSLTVSVDWAQGINAVSLSDKYAKWKDYDRMPDGSGIYHLVAAHNRPMRMTQAELEAHPAWRGFGEHAAEHPPMRGWIGVPLMARDGSNLGLIQLSDRCEGEFSEADEAILVQLAHLASVAIENVRLYQEARDANRAKSEFLAAMSHELRTPLNAISGYVDILDIGIHGPLTAAQRDSLARITANQQHLLTLINDILSFAQLEAGRMEFDIRTLSAREVLAGVESLVAPQATVKGIAYTVESCESRLTFLGDAERVRQVLLNLLTNAIKFTPGGGSVALSCDADERCVRLCVRDSGIGIAPEEQERIFDPFQQVGRRYNRPQEGVGLGLAISRDLARTMSGDLTVRSALGEGSTFTLRLPRAHAE